MLHQTSHYRLQKLTIYLFIILLWLPIFGLLTGINSKFNNTEKRRLNSFPSLDKFSPGIWTNNFNVYFDDNFGFRNLLITANNQFFIRLFNLSPIPIVLIGKDGWLFYKSESTGDGPSISDYQGLAPLTKVEVKKIASDLSVINSRLKNNGVTFLVVIGPNKSTIYSDYLPINVKKVGPQTRFDQLKKALARSSDVQILDNRQLLIESRKQLPTYSKTDTHWNKFGAFIASQQILKTLSTKFPDLKIPDMKDYSVRRSTSNGTGDIAIMLDAVGQFSDEKIELKTNKNIQNNHKVISYPPDAGGPQFLTAIPQTPKLLVFGDSYSGIMEFFLPLYFSQSTFIGLGPSYNFRWDIIDQEKPDIVIWEVAERFIDRLHL